MVLLTIGVGLFLFVFLVVVALVINPPNAWVDKLTDRKRNTRA